MATKRHWEDDDVPSSLSAHKKPRTEEEYDENQTSDRYEFIQALNFGIHARRLLHQERVKRENLLRELYASRQHLEEMHKTSNPSLGHSQGESGNGNNETVLQNSITQCSATITEVGSVLTEHMATICAAPLLFNGKSMVLKNLSPKDNAEFWDGLQAYTSMLTRMSELNARLENVDREQEEHEALYSPEHDMFFHATTVITRMRLSGIRERLEKDKIDIWEQHRDLPEELLRIGDLFFTTSGVLSRVECDCFWCYSNQEQVDLSQENHTGVNGQQRSFQPSNNGAQPGVIPYENGGYAERNPGDNVAEINQYDGGEHENFSHYSEPVSQQPYAASTGSLDMWQEYLGDTDSAEDQDRSPPPRLHDRPRPGFSVKQSGIHNYGRGRDQDSDRRPHAGEELLPPARISPDDRRQHNEDEALPPARSPAYDEPHPYGEQRPPAPRGMPPPQGPHRSGRSFSNFSATRTKSSSMVTRLRDTPACIFTSLATTTRWLSGMSSQ